MNIEFSINTYIQSIQHKILWNGNFLNSIFFIFNMERKLQLPRLDTLEKAKIVKFYKEYPEYERDLDAVNRNQSAAQCINKRTKVESIAKADKFLKLILSKDDF
jgi:hypothetical protein